VHKGRFLRADDRRQTVLGADFAASHGLGPGGTATLEDEAYTVAGVLERTRTVAQAVAIFERFDQKSTTGAAM